MPRHNSLLERQRLKNNLIERVNGAESRAGDLARQVLTTLAGDGRYFRRHGALDGVMPVLNAQTMFGAAGDGVADDSQPLKNAVNALEAIGRGILFLPQGDYKLAPEDGTLVFRDTSNIAIVGDNATLYYDAYTLNDSNTANVRLLQFTRCSNVVVTGLHLLLQIDYASAFTSAVNRVDELLSFYASDGVTSNVSIFGNIFEFDGPDLDDEGAGFDTRISILRAVGNQTTAARTARNFRVYDNTFLNCVGRGVYFAWARQIGIWGNSFRELGKYDDGAGNSGSQGGVAYRILGCKDVDVQVGIVDCYTGAIAGSPPDTEVKGLRVGKGNGAIGDKAQNIHVHDGVFNFNNCPGYGIWMADGPTQNVEFANLQINGDESYASNGGGGNQVGIRLEELAQSSGDLEHIRFRGITLRELDVHYESPAGAEDAYDDVLLESVQEVAGTNLVARYSGDAPAIYRRSPNDGIHVDRLRLAVTGATRDENGGVVSAEGFAKVFSVNGTIAFGLDERLPYIDYDTGGYHTLADAAFNRITGALTVGFWLYFDAAAGSQEYISGRVAIGTHISWFFRRNSGGKIRFSVSSDGSTETAADSDQSPAQATWVHVVGRYNPSNNVSVFINGLKTTNTTSIPASLSAGTQDLAIGAQSNGGAGMDGRVARWFMAATAMSDEAIIDLGQRERSLLYAT